ncbi:acetate kinase [Buchnera aphidicola]|uniref:Acetate kinase n=1 Tax=Buchnera aphidicola (Sarucallis kahawaluokalani) TaxID=1241878 RepID=A0A4D6Y7M5_9GAMM|nr:acetate kinase [Buchnera aphidicola]QCI25926.1 acetate kinase [Buchnera aphidicola (Sarucallis kahawaluokalani)]
MLNTVVLVLNCGSSSLKFSILDPINNKKYLFGLVERLYTSNSYITWYFDNKKNKKNIGHTISHSHAIKFIVQVIFAKYQSLILKIQYIGHRVVHGGDQFMKSVIINDSVIQNISKNTIFAPLHNPVNLLGIKAAIKYFPKLKKKNFAVFDTSLYYNIPEHAYLYPIPYEFYQKHRIRRYGAHGISYLYIIQQISKILNIDLKRLNIIICHLGGGASVSVFCNGICVDTSMGLTPLEGLVMGTRSGDIDPSIIFFMYNILGLSIYDIQNILINKSGITGLTNGKTSDFRDIEKLYYSDMQAYRTTNIFCYRLSKYISAYSTVCNGKIHALVFTGGIGENSALVRELTILRLSLIGFQLDNQNNYKKLLKTYNFIHKKDTIPILVIPTNEELMIAQEAIKLFR